MKKNETELIDYKKQYECLLTAKEYFKAMPNLCLETILGIALLDNDVPKKKEQSLSEYYSYYNRENAEQFNINPAIMSFDDRYHEELFLNFLFDVSVVQNKLQSNSKKIDVIHNETTCSYIGNQFITLNKCKICVNHIWSNHKVVYCLHNVETKKDK